MKRVVLLAWCFPLAAFGQESDGPNPGLDSAAAPDIRFTGKTYDFGIAGQHEKIVHEFGFANVGKGVLVIKTVRSSCGCIATVASSKEIPPGEAGLIKATFETGRYKGKQKKTIRVYSNDPDEPEVQLEITGVIKTEVGLEPEFLYFGKVGKGETVTRTLKLIQIGTKELGLNRVEVSREYFTTRVSSLQGGQNRGFQVDVVLEADAPVGRFTEAMTLHTNLKKRPRIDVPLYANVLGRIRVNPQMMSLGTLKKGSVVGNRLEVVCADHGEFAVVKVVPNPPFVLADVIRVNDGKFEIRLKIDEDAPAGRLAGEIDIYTDDPDESLVKVPVYGLITD